MSKGFELNNDDVVTVGNLTNSMRTFGAGSTFKIGDLLSLVKSWAIGTGGTANPWHQWFIEDGLKCQILQAKGGGWQKGRIRFRLEFIPDNPEAFIDKPTPEDKPNSPLDDLRAKLNNE